MKKILILVVSLLFISTVSAASSRSVVKCSGGMIHLGDLRYEVDDKCGEALQVDRVSGDDDIRVDRSTYKIKGSLYNLLFEGGELVSIKRA